MPVDTVISWEQRLVVAAAALVVLVFVGWAVFRERLELKYGLTYLLATLMMFVGLFLPERVLFGVARRLGFHLPANLLFLLMLCLLLVIVIQLAVTASRLAAGLTRLTQRMGLMQQRLDELEHGRGVNRSDSPSK